MRVSGLCTAAAAAFVFVSQAQAAVIVDESPAVLGGVPQISYSNFSGGQNFLVEFTLAQSTALTGMDIYTYPSQNALGDGVIVRLRNVVGGAPAATNLAEVTSTIDAIDGDGAGTTSLVRTHADFGPVTLGPGSYFIGMSGGPGFDITWAATAHNSQTVWLLVGETARFATANDDLNLRIYGDLVGPPSVPEPLTLSLFAAGLLGAGALRRRKMRA